MKWVVICALKKDCIAPPGPKFFCGFKFPRDRFGGCHRYDQSLQNILVSNAYNHEHEKCQYWSKDFAVMARGQLSLTHSQRKDCFLIIVNHTSIQFMVILGNMAPDKQVLN